MTPRSLVRQLADDGLADHLLILAAAGRAVGDVPAQTVTLDDVDVDLVAAELSTKPSNVRSILRLSGATAWDWAARQVEIENELRARGLPVPALLKAKELPPVGERPAEDLIELAGILETIGSSSPTEAVSTLEAWVDVSNYLEGTDVWTVQAIDVLAVAHGGMLAARDLRAEARKREPATPAPAPESCPEPAAEPTDGPPVVVPVVPLSVPETVPLADPPADQAPEPDVDATSGGSAREAWDFAVAQPMDPGEVAARKADVAAVPAQESVAMWLMLARRYDLTAEVEVLQRASALLADQVINVVAAVGRARMAELEQEIADLTAELNRLTSSQPALLVRDPALDAAVARRMAGRIDQFAEGEVA